jgi:hypothetical protein
MPDVETIEIPISRLKTILMFFGCLAFVVIGVCFVVSPEKFLSPVARSSTKIFIAGCLGIVFFGFVGITIFKKLFDRAPGFIISAEGITDNSGGLPAGFIPWSDIIAVKVIEINNQRLLNLVVRDRHEYIQRQKSAIKRMIMKKNFELYKGIGISANALKIDFGELRGIIEKRFSEFNTRRSGFLNLTPEGDESGESPCFFVCQTHFSYFPYACIAGVFGKKVTNKTLFVK